MKRPVAIPAAGALMLAAGLAAALQSAGDATAAQRQFRSYSVSPRSTAPYRNSVRPRLNRPRHRFTGPRLYRPGPHYIPEPEPIGPKRRRAIKHKAPSTKLAAPTPELPANQCLGGPKLATTPVVLTLGPNAVKPPLANASPIKLLPKGPKLTTINHMNFTIWRGPRTIWWNGKLQTLAALSAFSGFTLGDVYYLADGYVPLGYAVCHGLTEEGCALEWREVKTDDGDVIAQCVQFCPTSPKVVVDSKDTPADPSPDVANRAANAAVAAVVKDKGCDITIHADANFAGVNSEVTTDQPQLSIYGWDRSISSIDVKSGIWDFYTDDNYRGQMIRLMPGKYPKLEPRWDESFNSLMCSHP